MRRVAVIWLPVLLLACAGCAGAGGGAEGYGGTGPRNTVPAAARSTGTTPVAITLVKIWENEASQPYFPLEGLAGCVYTADGSLLVCDEKRGMLCGLDSGTGRWFQFATPAIRPYRPVDVQVDAFKVLVLDAGSRTVQRFDLSGAHQDEVLDFRDLDPSVSTLPGAFALDRDGRMVVTDLDQQDVLLLDTFLSLNNRLGGPGVADDQFLDPRGVTFLPDGRIVVADMGNARLSRYGRQGFHEDIAGGRFDPDNPFIAPCGVAADRHGNLFVVDLLAGGIIVLDRDLRPIPVLLDGELPEGPVAIAVGPAGQLAVTDRLRQAILIYRVLYE
ncbi:hypothetical protein CSB20_12635 [bacterium DOLZORAL124_64_63]|nr:MAG: hypothetical protein CSB20_12635 [bacterium DOLZORAL124_64_63]